MKKTAFFRLFLSFLLLAGVFATAGCSGPDVETDPTYKDKQKEEMYKNGSLASDLGGFTLLGGEDEKKAEGTGLGVNGFLWRAALDTLAFLPIASADPFGGVITTDWHSTEATPNERIRLNVLILDRDLRADGVKVTVFRQIRKEEGAEWEIAPVAPATASSLEDTILTRARQLRLAQREGR
jgi:hypothetical protein